MSIQILKGARRHSLEFLNPIRVRWRSPKHPRKPITKVATVSEKINKGERRVVTGGGAPEARVVKVKPQDSVKKPPPLQKKKKGTGDSK